MLMPIDEINRLDQARVDNSLIKLMQHNLTTNSVNFRLLRREYRKLHNYIYEELNRIGNYYSQFEDITVVGSVGNILYRRDVRVNRLQQYVKARSDNLVEQYLALLTVTLNEVQEISLNTVLHELEIAGYVIEDELLFEQVETMADYTDFRGLWILHNREFLTQLNEIILYGIFDHKSKTTVGRKLQGLFYDGGFNIDFRLNRTWITAIADRTNNTLNAIFNHVGIEFVRISDYAERFPLSSGASKVCKACHQRSRGGLLGQGIYKRSEVTVILHPFVGACLYL